MRQNRVWGWVWTAVVALSACADVPAESGMPAGEGAGGSVQVQARVLEDDDSGNLREGQERDLTYAYITQACAVEVHPTTGQARVLKVWAAHDVGRAVNPQGLVPTLEIDETAAELAWTRTLEFLRAKLG